MTTRSKSRKAAKLSAAKLVKTMSRARIGAVPPERAVETLGRAGLPGDPAHPGVSGSLGKAKRGPAPVMDRRKRPPKHKRDPRADD